MRTRSHSRAQSWTRAVSYTHLDVYKRQEHIFVLGENNRYRCAYCEQEYDSKTAKQL